MISQKILDRIRKYLNQVGRGQEFKQSLREENNRGVLPLWLVKK